MRNVREFKKSKGNLTIKTKIDLTPQTIVKTTVVCVTIVLVIIGVKKWL